MLHLAVKISKVLYVLRTKAGRAHKMTSLLKNKQTKKKKPKNSVSGWIAGLHAPWEVQHMTDLRQGIAW